MKRLFFVILFAALGLLVACSPTEPTAETQETVADQAGTTAGESTVMDKSGESITDEEMATGEMAEDESAMEKEGMVEQAEGEMATAEHMAEDQPMEKATADGETMDHEEMAADTMAEGMALPAWGQIALTNARTGETFSLSDFAGKTVFVEPMATWCTNCRQQLTNVALLRTEFTDENTMFIGLSLETNISDETLAQYADAQGFDWLFAVMTPQMLQELADQFGRVITSAPSTPHFIIRPDGSFTDLVTGIESPEQILAQLQAASG